MKLDIRMLVPGLPIDPEDPYSKSLGGSETAGLQLAAAIAELGHRVTAFCNVPGHAVWRDVRLAPERSFSNVCSATPSDLIIVQRSPLHLAMRFPTKVTMLWAHDLLFARRAPELYAAAHNIDRVVTVSDWQRRQWQEAYPDLPDRLFMVSRNGIDLAEIEASRKRVEASGDKRDPKLIVYGARPERGLDVLLNQVYPRILERVPDAKLAITFYDFTTQQTAVVHEELKRLAAKFNADGTPRVAWIEGLNKPRLYDLYHQAGLYLYPTPGALDPSFADTSCIAAMEAMACGMCWVSTDRGALSETVGVCGELVPLDGPHAGAGETPAALADAACEVLMDAKVSEEMQKLGRRRAAGLGWAPVAMQVVNEALAIMEQECADPVRLARHFIRRQDIEAADEMVGAVLDGRFQPEDADRIRPIADWLVERFAHADTPETLAAYYEGKVGPGNEHVFQGLLNHAPDDRFMERPFARFHMMDQSIRRHFKMGPELGPQPGREPLWILDFGCSQGECAVTLSNRLGADYVGVDASPDEVSRAKKLAFAKAKHPHGLTFICDDERLEGQFADHWKHGLGFDVAIMAEVLEHVADPIALVERIEGYVKPGGLICITMPYGPWETQQPEPLRGQHLREWSNADLEDIFGGKSELVLDVVPLAQCPVTGEVLGNTHVTYQVDHKPLGEIDWQRKLRQQRPRQTLSAMMIVGGPNDHQTLHWCLESIAPIADEIVIGDTGASDEACRIWERYGARAVKVPPPREAGFEASRNAVLDACTGDWVMMIDGDERMISARTLWRYLRENIFHSYSIQHHHFAVDGRWKPDLPARVFRRRPGESGKPMRFFGILHEHAEFGINEGAGRALLLSDVHLAHVGYLDQNTRSGRFERNLPMLMADQRKYPDRKLGLMIMMRDSVVQAKKVLAGNRVDFSQPGSARLHPAAFELCEDVLRIYRETFADDPGRQAADAAGFYFEATHLLGSDVVADVQVAAQRQGIGDPVGPEARRFASVDDFKRFMAARTKAAVEPISGAWF
ncbi:MAG: glycosyl transferase group 1 [Microvirga sp.]|jgi:glycosyltransferase involved in cell wall biosynthesis/SAM-dependent methyltransferase|nr:glycosyl transferase group 1 [Microvirga sp.]